MLNPPRQSRQSLLVSTALCLAPLLSAGCADESTALEPPPSASAAPEAVERYIEQDCADHEDEIDPGARERAAHPVAWRSPQRHHARRTVAVKLLGINDFHGQLVPRTVAGRPAGGAAVLASYLRAAGADFPGKSVIVHAGDLVGASPPASALLQDEPSIQFMNMLGNAHCSTWWPLSPLCNVVGTPGNHEFDEGQAELLRLVRGGNHASGPFLQDPYRGAAYANISANVVEADTGRTMLPPVAIKFMGGVPVAFIGAVLEQTPTIVTPDGVAGLRFLDEADTINQYVRLLKCFGIKTIVVTIHQGARQTSFEGPTPEEPSTEVSGEIVDIVSRLDPEVDVVVSGHTHAFTNALLPSTGDEPVLVVQAFSASTAYDDIDLVLDARTGDVVEKSARIVTTFGDVAPGDAPAPDVAELVSAAVERTDPLVNTFIATAAGTLTREQSPAGESALGNLIADAQRAAMGTQLAFMNPGGVRADLDGGDVTWGDLFTVQPFGNSLVAMTLTGAQIDELLEQQWVGQPNPTMLQVSGLSYSWSASAANGERVGEILVEGAPIDPAASYTVAVNSFIAAGGDNFTVLVEGTDRVGGAIDLDALIAYVQSLPQPFTAAIEGRVTQLP